MVSSSLHNLPKAQDRTGWAVEYHVPNKVLQLKRVSLSNSGSCTMLKTCSPLTCGPLAGCSHLRRKHMHTESHSAKKKHFVSLVGTKRTKGSRSSVACEPEAGVMHTCRTFYNNRYECEHGIEILCMLQSLGRWSRKGPSMNLSTAGAFQKRGQDPTSIRLVCLPWPPRTTLCSAVFSILSRPLAT